MREAIGVDVYNQEIIGDVAATLTGISGGTNTVGPKVLITVDDQGGGEIRWNYIEMSPALRSEMGSHPPVVVLKHEERSDLRN